MLLQYSCGYSREDYITERPDTKPDVKDAILRGEVMINMTPDEAIAAAEVSMYKIVILKQDPKWPDIVDPNQIVDAQHYEPDSSMFRLDFSNKTQFQSKEDTVFSVCFRDGRVFRISQGDPNMCGTETATSSSKK